MNTDLAVEDEPRPKILIIDDEEAARYGISRALSSQNYDVALAGDGSQALQKLAIFEPDVVLSDINMPGMDGITLLRRVRERPNPPPVVLITAYGSEELAIDALRAGAYDYIHKPFEIDELRAVLRNALEHQRLARQNCEYYAQLERALADLRNSQAALVQSEKMASLGRLVGGLAHEIHTPLGVIQSSADTIERAAERVAAGQRENSSRYLDALKDASEQLRKACSRVQGIVANLREFAQIDRAEVLLIDVHRSIDATLRLVEQEFSGHIAVEKDYSELPEIECYPRDLHQLFMNLLLNSRDSIRASGREGWIRIRTRTAKHRNREAVFVEFEDNSGGMSQDMLDHVFDPAFVNKDGRIGVGFGLAICYRIAQSHGGTIEPSSIPGQGNLFRVVLPVKLQSNTES